MSDDTDTWGIHDDVAFQVTADPDGPLGIANRFWVAVLDGDVDQLRTLVTPESVRSWGDFTGAREAMFEDIDSPGLGVEERTVDGVDHMRWFAVYGGAEHLRGWGTEPVAFLTLVHRPATGWRVHAFGGPVPPHLIEPA